MSSMMTGLHLYMCDNVFSSSDRQQSLSMNIWMTLQKGSRVPSAMLSHNVNWPAGPELLSSLWWAQGGAKRPGGSMVVPSRRPEWSCDACFKHRTVNYNEQRVRLLLRSSCRYTVNTLEEFAITATSTAKLRASIALDLVYLMLV